MARGTRRVADLTNKGLVAFNCGLRLFQTGEPWDRWIMEDRRCVVVVLTESELAAWNWLTPAAWSASWWRGWDTGRAEKERGQR